MQAKAFDGNNGGVAKSGEAEIRARIMEAMLEVVGEDGYRNLSVRKVLDRQGGSRNQFYKHFSCAAACYEEAYAIEAERLCEAILRAGRGGDNWEAGLEAALEELARFALERPAVARSVLVEVHVAGGPTLWKRKEVFERLSRAIDSARRETVSRHSPPPMTATFIVHMLDAALVDALVREAPQDFEPAALAKLPAIYYDLAAPKT
jgi:AcrR family transcriptional regulator